MTKTDILDWYCEDQEYSGCESCKYEGHNRRSECLPAKQLSAMLDELIQSSNLRDKIAIAMIPQSLQDDGGTVVDAANELGIEAKEYNAKRHWPLLAAKHAYEWADIMIQVRNKEAK